jgi:hypothetical protein
MAWVIPENFDFLHGGQERIRELSKAEIAASDVLLRHFNAAAESLTAIDHFAHYDHAGEMNSLSSCLASACSTVRPEPSKV